ncbi:MAG: FecR domain-containing protein [Candidatus Aminicenantes bacterium]|nr:FecR domain-containing protein [Candidatus Aminicenantes bacterium]
MRKNTIFCFCLIIFCLGFMNSVFAQSHYRYINDPNTDVYFGHISYTEAQFDGKDPVVLREGQTMPEVAVLNFPIAPGDTVSTPSDRRCEIQFDSGTIIRLDSNTEIKIETILAQSLSSSSKITNFVLLKGQIYVMYKQYGYSEILQILFPNASAKFKHKSVLMIRANPDGSSNLKVDTGEASVLFGSDEQHLEKIDLKRSEEATITVQNQILYTKYEGDVDFSLWNLEMNKNFLALHQGMSDLPKPIQRLSPAVFNFAQKFSNLFGEWLWNDIYGYVWRPFTNDQYPSGDWMPYQYGMWRRINDDLFWVPQESWGWVPYHLGVWVWDKKSGWLWLPGRAFAPSWASWNFYNGYFSWRPITLFDWLFMGYSYSYFPQDISNVLHANEKTGFYDDQYYSSSSIKKTILNQINKNQLKSKGSVPAVLPKNMRKILANLASALKKGDTSVLSSMKEMPDPKVVVQGNHLSSSSVTKLMMEMDQMSALIQGGLMNRNLSVDPLGYARIAFNRNDFIASLARNMTDTQPYLSGGPATSSRMTQPSEWISEWTKTTVKRQPSLERNEFKHSSNRMRDWNPDVKVANRLGVAIKYSSLENTIRVPELERASDTGRVGGFNLSRSSSTSRSASSSSGSTSSSSSSGSVGSSSSSSSRSSSSTGSKSSSTKSSTSKTIKKF